jgi:hypothetical protein
VEEWEIVQIPNINLYIFFQSIRQLADKTPKAEDKLAQQEDKCLVFLVIKDFS